MPNLNLIKETDNIRNRLRPYKNSGLRLAKKAIVTGILLAGVWLLFFQETADDNKPDTQVVIDPAEAPSPIVKKPEKEIVEEKAEEPKPKPELTSLPTRPVAQAVTEKAPEEIKDKWRVRFGVFAQEENGRNYAADLTKRGVAAQVVEGTAAIMTHRVIYGPWPTDSQAINAKEQLKKEGILASRFMAGGKKYLSTGPLRNAEEAESLRKKGAKLGVRSEVSRKKETRRVFRVYKKKGYQTKEKATKEQRRLKKRGVDNVVEQIQ